MCRTRRFRERFPMIVHCAGFGSRWYGMFGKDDDGSYLPTRSVYFNSTAIAHIGNPSKVSRRWGRSRGEIRIHPSGFQFMRKPQDLLEVNSRALLTVMNGVNRLLLYRAVPKSIPVDAVLLTVRRSIYGAINFDSTWRRGGVRLISSSWSMREQETLLLMADGSSIRTDEGIWTLRWTGREGHKKARLCPATGEIIERGWSQKVKADDRSGK
jgi:hypothetical protein